MSMSTAKKVGKRLLQIGLPVLIIGFFLSQVKNNWSALTAQSFHLNVWLLILSFVGFVCQEISYGLIWKAVLARLGARLGLRASMRIYLASEFVRYIPGNVWHVLTYRDGSLATEIWQIAPAIKLAVQWQVKMSNTD